MRVWSIPVYYSGQLAVWDYLGFIRCLFCPLVLWSCALMRTLLLYVFPETSKKCYSFGKWVFICLGSIPSSPLCSLSVVITEVFWQSARRVLWSLFYLTKIGHIRETRPLASLNLNQQSYYKGHSFRLGTPASDHVGMAGVPTRS